MSISWLWKSSILKTAISIPKLLMTLDTCRKQREIFSGERKYHPRPKSIATNKVSNAMPNTQSKNPDIWKDKTPLKKINRNSPTATLYMELQGTGQNDYVYYILKKIKDNWKCWQRSKNYEKWGVYVKNN